MKETIVALSTPPGISGIAVIRLSGEDAVTIADKCFFGKFRIREVKTHTIHLGVFKRADKIIDTVMASVFITPHSYTGEDIIEFSCHGGMLIAGEIINTLIENGARIAEPGEFTRRAFLNGKMDLTQAEAVADIIHSTSLPGGLTAVRQLVGEFTSRLKNFRSQLLDICSLIELELDFSDEDIEFVDKHNIQKQIREAIDYCLDLSDSYKSAEILRSGFFVAISGFPNSGKSTLFNKLLQRNRAIVSPIPGTTRDYLEESLFLNGIMVKLVDTAGLRPTEESIEIEGIRFTESMLEQANMNLILNDISIDKNHSNQLFEQIKIKFPATKTILIQNKIDKIGLDDVSMDVNMLYLAAKKGIGIDLLKDLIACEAAKNSERLNDVLINQRHSVLLKSAADNLGSALESLNKNMSNEIIAIDLRSALKCLGEITGESWSEEVLNNIFSRFCIGK